MCCIEAGGRGARRRRCHGFGWVGWLATAGFGCLTACSPSPPPPGAASAPTTSSAAGATSGGASTPGASSAAGATSVPGATNPGTATGASAPTAASGAGSARPTTAARSAERPPRHGEAPTSRLAAPSGTARDWAEYRHRAAQRLVAANPGRSHTGPVHEPLLAVPVLQIDLHADGSVQRIAVLRHPHFAKDTTKLAEDAVRRAAPFGSVAHLPKPWRLTETFLFDEERRFKPRTLDE